MKRYYVYILSDRHRGTLYTGVTSDLERRVAEHKSRSRPGFTSKYYANILVFFEETHEIGPAIAREKQIKGWNRAKKVALIETVNPLWRDLSAGVPEDGAAEDKPAAAPPPDSPSARLRTGFAERRIADKDAVRRSE